MVQVEMSLESRVTSHESGKKTENKNSCYLCYSLLQSFGCGWDLKQTKNLCFSLCSLCVFYFSVLSVVKYLWVVCGNTNPKNPCQSVANSGVLGWVLNTQTKNLCFSLCSPCVFFFSVSSVVNFRDVGRVLNNIINNLCVLCVLCGSKTGVVR